MSLVVFLFALVGLMLLAVCLAWPWGLLPLALAAALVALRRLATPPAASGVVRERESA